MCLSRGSAKKRKLTQRTLLQMNFCSQERVQIKSSEREQIGNDLLLISCDESIVRNGFRGLADLGGVEETDSLSDPLLNLESVMQIHIDGTSKNPFCGKNTDDINDRHSLSMKSEVPDGDTEITLDDISDVILETFIVGRRFSEEKEINPGASILLVRDPHNVKDPNAVKVSFQVLCLNLLLRYFCFLQFLCRGIM